MLTYKRAAKKAIRVGFRIGTQVVCLAGFGWPRSLLAVDPPAQSLTCWCFSGNHLYFNQKVSSLKIRCPIAVKAPPQKKNHATGPSKALTNSHVATWNLPAGAGGVRGKKRPPERAPHPRALGWRMPRPRNFPNPPVLGSKWPDSIPTLHPGEVLGGPS